MPRKPNAVIGGSLLPLDPIKREQAAPGPAKSFANQASLNKLMTGSEDSGPAASGTSIFDPVLTELAYTWFCPPGGTVLDPFAGGSVRGIVASKLGRQYIGLDLSARQIAANRKQAAEICLDDPLPPQWIVGNSLDVATLAPGLKADMIFSCPPYFDLEVYSNDAADLSTMSYAQFRTAYAAIIKQCVAMLKPNRFAGFVVGDVRDKQGFYRGFPWHTIEAFEQAGARLYNEAALVTAVGSLPVRAGKQFSAGRKLGKTHQNFFIFCKGDPRAASDACGKLEID